MSYRKKSKLDTFSVRQIRQQHAVECHGSVYPEKLSKSARSHRQQFFYQLARQYKSETFLKELGFLSTRETTCPRLRVCNHPDLR